MTNDSLPIKWTEYPSVQGYKETILAAKPRQTNSKQEFKAPIQLLSEILSQPNFMATFDPPGKEQMYTMAPWTLLIGYPKTLPVTPCERPFQMTGYSLFGHASMSLHTENSLVSFIVSFKYAPNMLFCLLKYSHLLDISMADHLLYATWTRSITSLCSYIYSRFLWSNTNWMI